MNTLPSFRKSPLATALVIGGALLIGLAGCSKKSDEAAENAPPASATAAAPEAASTASGGMASDTSGMGAPASADSTAADMAGAGPAGADTAGMGADMTSGPITDTQFYTQAMTRDQEEITTAQMVAGQSSDAGVKALANKIIGDHQSFDKKVQSAAGASVTAPSGTVDANVQGKTGKDLDKAYVDAMVADHEKDITMFENAAKNASTPDARKLASAALPTLHNHLKMAQDLQKKMGATS